MTTNRERELVSSILLMLIIADVSSHLPTWPKRMLFISATCFFFCFFKEWLSSLPSLKRSSGPGRRLTTMKMKRWTVRTRRSMDRPTPTSAGVQVPTYRSPHFHLIAFHFWNITKINTPPSASSPPTPPHPNCPPIFRCSDFMLLPQTPPRPLQPQEHHDSLSALLARLRPLAAQRALACPTAGRSLTTTHVQPRPTGLFCPTTAQAPF